LAHFYCGQTAGCIKMPLGMEIGLQPGDFVLDGDPAPFPKGGGAPQFFGPCLLWMNQDGTWHGGRPWSSPHCTRWGHNSPPPKGGRVLNFRPIFIVANGWMHQHVTWYGGKPQPRRLCVRWAPSPYPKSGGAPTQFSAHVYCGQTAAWIKMPFGTGVGIGLRDTVFDVDQATPRKKWHTHPAQYLAHVYCGQMVGWMKTPLGTEVYLGPGHIVLDGAQLPRKGPSSPRPLFGPCLLSPRSPISATAELLLHFA